MNWLIFIVLWSAGSASPCIYKPQGLLIPYSIHQQKPNRHKGDYDYGERRSSFGQGDNENNNRYNDLHRCVRVNALVTLHTFW